MSDERFIICAYWITRMPSMVFDVHTVGVGCIKFGYVICLFVVMSAVTGSDSFKLALPHSLG